MPHSLYMACFYARRGLVYCYLRARYALDKQANFDFNEHWSMLKNTGWI